MRTQTANVRERELLNLFQPGIGVSAGIPKIGYYELKRSVFQTVQNALNAIYHHPTCQNVKYQTYRLAQSNLFCD